MFGFAKKIGMTRLFLEGKSTPVTALQFDDNFVVTEKTKEKDGYSALQIGSVRKSTKQSSKAELGHITKNGLTGNFRCLGEFRGQVALPEDKKVITVEDFQVGEVVDVTGNTIGRGFTGAVKRYGFAGQPASHGHDHERAVGSIGCRWPQRVDKGKRMAGHFGNESVCVKNLTIVAIDVENKLIFVDGSVPGSNSKFLTIKPAKTPKK